MFVSKIVRTFGGITAGAALLACLVCIGGRLFHPYTLAATESPILQHVQRLWDGRALFVTPSLEFVPFLYPPFYYYLAAALGNVTGQSIVALRLISVTATLICFLILGITTYRLTRDKLAGFFAVGFFALMYFYTALWYDSARVDMLFLALILMGWYFLVFTTGLTRHFLGVTWLFLACLTKQNAIVFIALILTLALYYARTKERIILIIYSFVLFFSSWLYLNHTSNGWFNYYIFTLPAHHQWHFGKLIAPILHFVPLLAPTLVVSLLFLWTGWRELKSKAGAFFFVLFISTLIIASCVGKTGGWINHLIPFFAAFAILFGLAFHRFSFGAGKSSSFNTILPIILLVAIGLQFGPVLVVNNPVKAVLKDVTSNRLKSQRIIGRLSQIEGPVFFLQTNSYLGFLAGKSGLASFDSAQDLLWAQNDPVGLAFAEQFIAAIHAKVFGAIVIDLDQYYEVNWNVHPAKKILTAINSSYETGDLLTAGDDESAVFRGRIFVPRRTDKTKGFAISP